MRLMPIRQARLKPLALSASGHEKMVDGWAASGKKRINLSVGIAWFGDMLNIDVGFGQKGYHFFGPVGTT